MKTTRYFQTKAILSHPEANRTDWIEKVMREPEASEVQEDRRIRYWAYIPEADKYLRVVTLEDKLTVHNAFFDENYPRRRRRH
ncbi:MAG: hypothetical protein HY680_05145 [Chloroflexi bacterium]|nr:hypothetical protein [Chloroflexota bacterium]